MKCVDIHKYKKQYVYKYIFYGLFPSVEFLETSKLTEDHIQLSFVKL